MTPKFGSSKQFKPAMPGKDQPTADQGKGLVRKQSSSEGPAKTSRLGKPVFGDINEPLDEALEEVNQELLQNPDDPELHKRKISILRKQNDNSAMQQALEDAMENCPDVFFAVKLADILEGRGAYAKAQELRQWVLDRQPDDPDSVRRLAATAARAYDLPVAEKNYLRLIELRDEEDCPLGATFFEEMLGKGLKPDQRSQLQQMGLHLVARALMHHDSNASLLEAAARLAYRTKNYTESRGAYEQAIKTNPTHRNIHMWKVELLRVYAQLGLQQHWSRLSSEFIAELQDQVAKDRTNQRTWNLLATQQIQAGLFDDAITTLKDALSADSKNAQALWELGRLYVRRGEAQNAIDYYRDIIEDPNERKSIRRGIEKALAELYFKLGMYDDALSIYMSDEENNSAIIAPILEATGQIPEAQMLYIKSVTQSPRDAKCHLGLAEYWVRQGNWEQAIQAARDGLECNYATEEVHTNLAVALATAYMKQSNFEAALQAMDEICEFYPDSIHCVFRKVKLLLLLKRVKEAAVLAEEVRQSAEHQTGCAPASSVLWALLGDTCSLAHRDSEAERAYAQAVKYDAMNATAVRGLAILAEHKGDLIRAYSGYKKFVTLEPLNLATPVVKRFLERIASKLNAEELQLAESGTGLPDIAAIEAAQAAEQEGYLGSSSTRQIKVHPFPGLPSVSPIKRQDTSNVDKTGWLGDGRDYGYEE
ncbi:MAG: tetratricopeptide repeat protein [Candidatus Bruticola sp.]